MFGSRDYLQNMERWTWLLVTSLCVISSSSQTDRIPLAESARCVSHVPALAGMSQSQFMKTSAGEKATSYDDLGNILAVVSESWVHFWSQQLPQLLADQAATGESNKARGAGAGAHTGRRGENQCVYDFARLFQTYTGSPYNHSLGSQAIDAFGKPGSGILEGNIYAYGSFDECFAIGEDKVKYLVAPLMVSRVINFRKCTPLFFFVMGMCFPQSCNGAIVKYLVNQINKAILPHTNNTYLLCVEESEIVFTTRKQLPYTAGAIVMITICALFATLVFVATLLEKLVSHVLKMLKQEFSMNEDPGKLPEQSLLLGKTQHKRETWQQKSLDVIFAFSLFKNVSMILATKQPPDTITSLNGIRVLSMFWLIVCDTYHCVAIFGLIKNPTVMFTVVKRFSIINGSFSVDSFFFLSGTLAAYLTLREIERKRGWFFVFYMNYIHRYLRLTLVYAFVLFFYWFLTVYLGDGNIWIDLTGPDSSVQKNCEHYWWTNLLYINNLYPGKVEEECLYWSSWYLSNDMQFHIIAPFIIIPLFFFLPIGLALSGVFLAASFITTGTIAGVNNFSASVFQQILNDTTFQQILNGTAEFHQLDDIFIKPYCRIPPYFVGLVLGYLLYKKLQFPCHWFVNWIIYICLWTIAAGCCVSTMYGLYDTWHGHELSRVENMSYLMFSRFTWAVGLALMVFACHSGYGWVINDFLSMKFWIPLSRLTYTAALVHGIILTVTFGSLRDPITYTDNILAVLAIAIVVLSYGVAGVVAAFVEFPFSNLEMALFKVVGLQLRESTRRVEVHSIEGTIEEYTSSTNR